MKIFCLWLIAQAVMARVLFGMSLWTWADMHLPPDTLFLFVVPTMFICIAEAITSAIVVFPLIKASAGTLYR